MGRSGHNCRQDQNEETTVAWPSVKRMADNRMPRSVLFGWLSEPRPRCGPRKRWRDVIRKDLAYIGVDENKWYEEATKSRAGWRALCHCGITAHQDEIQVNDQLIM